MKQSEVESQRIRVLIVGSRAARGKEDNFIDVMDRTHHGSSLFDEQDIKEIRKSRWTRPAITLSLLPNLSAKCGANAFQSRTEYGCHPFKYT